MSNTSLSLDFRRGNGGLVVRSRPRAGGPQVRNPIPPKNRRIRSLVQQKEKPHLHLRKRNLFLNLRRPCLSKTGASLKDLKPKKSIALEAGKAGLATKGLPSLFGNPSTSELLKIHPSEDDDDDLQMSCEQPATPLTGVDNSPPLSS
ncbi:hypothetical protein AVEN_156585-1 [Araneus ventricosus]|uniref:Uncharacterized protein n=1 Tax=Araneus ventricosus TaxID=182803 RepID=A0A4Y2EVF6_ARAVE|nr:hypothetical protein AVEN_156585-1 [Araneus ventricosus]